MPLQNISNSPRRSGRAKQPERKTPNSRKRDNPNPISPEPKNKQTKGSKKILHQLNMNRMPCLLTLLRPTMNPLVTFQQHMSHFSLFKPLLRNQLQDLPQ